MIPPKPASTFAAVSSHPRVVGAKKAFTTNSLCTFRPRSSTRLSVPRERDESNPVDGMHSFHSPGCSTRSRVLHRDLAASSSVGLRHLAPNIRTYSAAASNYRSMAADAESSDTNQEDLASNHVKHSSTCRRRHRQPISASAPPPQDLSFPSHLTNPSPYEIFHLSRDCTSRQVKSRYYDLVKLLHPDKAFAASNASKVDTKAQENFKKVVQAYELLRDPKRRSLYDRTGFGWTTAGGGTQVTAYDEWCGALRRGGSPGGTRSPAWEDPRYKRYGKGHDGYGWQSATGRPDDFSFYGFYAPKDKAHMPRYTSNKVFFTSIMIVTWVVAAFQYQRLSAQSARAVARADKNHLEAAKSLDEARDLARSEEGRRRLEAFKRRARETRVLEAIEKMEAEALARQTQNGTILPSHLIEPVRASHDHRNVG